MSGQSASTRAADPGFPQFLRHNAPWLAAGGLLSFMSSFGQTFFISVFGGEIRDAFDLSHGQWGVIYTIGTGLSAFVMIWAGMLTDIFRVRFLGPVILAGLAGACLTMALNPWAALLPAVIFLLRLFGQSMSSHIANVAMARWFVRTRGRALAVSAMGFSVGEALLPVLFVALMTVLDWRVLWMISAGFILTGMPVLLLLLRQERTPQSVAKDSHSTGLNGRNWTRGEAIANPLFWCLIPALLGPSAFNTAFFFHQVHFADIKGWAHVDLVALFPIYTAMAVFWMVASGWALDRVGAMRLMPYYQLPLILAFLLFSVASDMSTAIVALCFLAITSGCQATLSSAFWAEAYGTAHIGSIKSLAAAVMVLGSAVGPGLTGYLIDFGIDLPVQFVGIAVFFAMASGMTYFGIQRARRVSEAYLDLRR